MTFFDQNKITYLSRFVFTHITQTQTQSRKSAFLDLFKFMQILNMGPFWFVLLPLLEVGIETLKVVQNFFMISRLRERGGFSLHGNTLKF